MSDVRKCTRCLTDKPTTEFGLCAPGGRLKWRCRQCERDTSRERLIAQRGPKYRPMTGWRARFADMYIPEPNSGCWLWTGPDAGYGYGRVGADGGAMRAHRASWLLYRGDIPAGKIVCHKCDVRCCVNPDHLFLGSHDDNMRDMVRKGRTHKWAGIEKRQSKLTPEAVLAIRASGQTHRELAEQYGVNSSAISLAKSGKRWGWVREDV